MMKPPQKTCPSRRKSETTIEGYVIRPFLGALVRSKALQACLGTAKVLER